MLSMIKQESQIKCNTEQTEYQESNSPIETCVRNEEKINQIKQENKDTPTDQPRESSPCNNEIKRCSFNEEYPQYTNFNQKYSEQDLFQYLSKNTIESDQNKIQRLGRLILNQEIKQDMRELKKQIEEKSLKEIYSFKNVKNAFDLCVSGFQKNIEDQFEKFTRSKLVLFDSKKIISEYKLPPFIEPQFLVQLNAIHSQMLNELVNDDYNEGDFEIKINEDLVKQILLIYLLYYKECDIISTISANCSAIQNLTKKQLQYFERQGQNPHPKYINKLKQNFISLLDKISKRFIEQIQRRFITIEVDDKDFQQLQNKFENVKNDLNDLINEYDQIEIENVSSTKQCLSGIIIYKKIQIQQQKLNQILEQNQQSLNNLVNSTVFGQEQTIKFDMQSLESEVSKDFRQYIKNDVCNLLAQILEKKEDPIIDIANCTFDQTVVNNYYENKTAEDLFEFISIYKSLQENIILEEDIQDFNQTLIDNIRRFFSKNNLRDLFRNVIFKEINDDLILNFEKNQRIFYLRYILQSVDKIFENVLNYSNNYKLREKKELDYYFSSNEQSLYFKLKFMPKLPNELDDNTVYATINLSKRIKELAFRIKGQQEPFILNLLEDLPDFNHLSKQQRNQIEKFIGEQESLPYLLFEFERSHKSGIVAMYLYEKFNTIKQQILFKNGQQSNFFDFFSLSKDPKQQETQNSILSMNLIQFQLNFEYFYQQSIEILQLLNKPSQQIGYRKLQNNTKDQLFVEFLLNKTPFQDYTIQIFNDTLNIPIKVIFQQKSQDPPMILSFEPQQIGSKIQIKSYKYFQILFQTQFEKIVFFNELLQKSSQTDQSSLIYFYECLQLVIQNYYSQNEVIQFSQEFLNQLKKQLKTLDNQKQQNIRFNRQQLEDILKHGIDQNIVNQYTQDQTNEQKYGLKQRNIQTNSLNSNEHDFNNSWNNQTKKSNNNNSVGIIQKEENNSIIQSNQNHQMLAVLSKQEFGYEINQESFTNLQKHLPVLLFQLDYLKKLGYIDEIRSKRYSDLSDSLIIPEQENSSFIMILNEPTLEFILYINKRHFYFYAEEKQNLRDVKKYSLHKIRIEEMLLTEVFQQQDITLKIFEVIVWITQIEKTQFKKFECNTYSKNIDQQIFLLFQQQLWIRMQMRYIFEVQNQSIQNTKFAQINLLKISQDIMNYNNSKLCYFLTFTNYRDQIKNPILIKRFVYQQKEEYELVLIKSFNDTMDYQKLKNNLRLNIIEFDEIDNYDYQMICNKSLPYFLTLNVEQEKSLYHLVKQFLTDIKSNFCSQLQIAYDEMSINNKFRNQLKKEEMNYPQDFTQIQNNSITLNNINQDKEIANAKEYLGYEIKQNSFNDFLKLKPEQNVELIYLKELGYIDQIKQKPNSKYILETHIEFYQNSQSFVMVLDEDNLEFILYINKKYFYFYIDQKQDFQYIKKYKIQNIQIKGFLPLSIFKQYDMNLFIFEIIVWMKQIQNSQLDIKEIQTYNKNVDKQVLNLYQQQLWIRIQLKYQLDIKSLVKQKIEFEQGSLTILSNNFRCTDPNKYYFFTVTITNSQFYNPILIKKQISQQKQEFVFIKQKKDTSNYIQYKSSQIQNLNQIEIDVKDDYDFRIICLQILPYFLAFKANQEKPLLDLVKRFLVDLKSDICSQLQMISSVGQAQSYKLK